MTNSIGSPASKPVTGGPVATPIGGVPANKTPIGSTTPFAPPANDAKRVIPALVGLSGMAARARNSEFKAEEKAEEKPGVAAPGSQTVTQTSARDSSGGEQGDAQQRALRLQARAAQSSAQAAFTEACNSKTSNAKEKLQLGIAVILSAMESVAVSAVRRSELIEAMSFVQKQLGKAGIALPVGSENWAALIKAMGPSVQRMKAMGNDVPLLLLPMVMLLERKQIELTRPVPVTPVAPHDYASTFRSIAA